MTILMIAAGLITTGILFGLFATATAPVGYEDASGFHFGNENGQGAPSRSHETEHLPHAAGLTPHHA